MSNSSLGRRDFFKIIGGALGISAISYYLGFRDKPNTFPHDESPDYADSGVGMPVFRGPYLQKDVHLAAFVFPADVYSLIALCDQTLNVVSSCPYRYVPLLSSVMLVYADMLVSSLDERDAQAGSIHQTEVGFWVLTVAMQKTPNGEIPHHLAWFLPTILTDDSNSIATGREVYGFNKQAASFNKPQEISSPGFAVDVFSFKQFSPSAIAQKERLLELVMLGDEHSQTNWSDWHSVRDHFASEIVNSIRPELGSAVIGFAAQALVDHIPLVFLKQLRSASEVAKASHQKIVEAPLKIREFYGGAKFRQSFQLGISHLDSHPLMTRLGIKPAQVNSIGAWIKVDFVLGFGTEY